MNKNKTKQYAGYVWKADAGRTLFYIVTAFVIINQLMPATGVKVPWTPSTVYAWVVAGFVIWHATITKGWKRAFLAFLALLFVGFLMEGLGVNYGLIYGPYHYHDDMGSRIWGVPPVVPVSWELNMYPAFYLALYLLPTDQISNKIKSWNKAIFVLVLATISGLFCTFYDLIADPVYCLLTDKWVWHRGGDFAVFARGGIPIANYIGWIITGVVGSIVYYFILSSTPPKEHVKSDYLGLWIPLMMYVGALIMPISANFRFVHNETISLVAIVGMGTVILMVLSKYFFEKFGYGYSEHPTNLSSSLAEEDSESI